MIKEDSVSVLRGKVQGMYDVIGARGLYVNTNHDVFVGPRDIIKVGMNGQFEYRLLQDGGKAYASPLLFATLTSLLNHGSMLITGAPGIGKTTAANVHRIVQNAIVRIASWDNPYALSMAKHLESEYNTMMMQT